MKHFKILGLPKVYPIKSSNYTLSTIAQNTLRNQSQKAAKTPKILPRRKVIPKQANKKENSKTTQHKEKSRKFLFQEESGKQSSIAKLTVIVVKLIVMI
jgi:hypothetical protein